MSSAEASGSCSRSALLRLWLIKSNEAAIFERHIPFHGPNGAILEMHIHGKLASLPAEFPSQEGMCSAAAVGLWDGGS